MSKILVVDDEQSVLDVLRIVLSGSGYEVVVAATEEAARDSFERERPDLVLQDLRMVEDDSGLGLLRSYQSVNADIPVIIITAHSNWDSTNHAVQEGAHAYITKPFDNETIREVVGRALAQKAAPETGGMAKSGLAPSEILGNSVVMRDILAKITRIAPTGSTVLITGESGTGKELVARALHYCSRRADGPFIGVNSGAFPEKLLESELFGHVKGAFSSAHKDKKGLLEVAQGGTFFFDEVGDVPLDMQVKLLRVLEEQTFYPVGGVAPVHIDVRFIGATNKDLYTEVEEGRFREDLFYRLNVIPIHLPPLRERKGDIELLASHFVHKYARAMGREIVDISPRARARMLDYDWPGNIRELQNTIERSVAFSSGSMLDEIAVQRRPGSSARLASAAPPPSVAPGNGAAVSLEVPPAGLDLEGRLADIERAYIKAALARTGGHLTNAAKLLNISFRSIRYKVQKLGIKDKDEL